MPFEIPKNKGYLFLEEDKRGGAPDYKGSINIDGKIIKLAAWKNKTKAGKSMIGLQVDTYEKDNIVTPKDSRSNDSKNEIEHDPDVPF